MIFLQVTVLSDMDNNYGTEASFYSNLNGTVPTTTEYRDTVTATNDTAKILQVPEINGTIYCRIVGDEEKKTNVSIFIVSQKQGNSTLYNRNHSF